MFRILGPLSIGDGEAALAGAKQHKLLACLLLSPNRAVQIDSILDAMWDDEAPNTAIRQVRNTVSGLRRVLLNANITGPIIHTEGSGYRMEITDDDLDALVFNRLVAEADAQQKEDPAAAVDTLRKALGLWRGTALAGLGSRSLAVSAEAWDRKRLSTIERRIELELGLGRHGAVASELSELVAEHPLNERFRAQLMIALYRLGQPAEALEVYRQTRTLLIDYLGIEPNQQLADLEQRILRRDPALDPAPPPEEPAPAPREARRAAPTPAELPTDIPDFTGRADQLGGLDALMDGIASAVRIAVISGMAGMGKTALAVHWSHRVAESFPDGQLYVNLRGYGPGAPVAPIEALASLLRALGVSGEAVPVDERDASRLLRSELSGKQVLLLLDNARAVDQVRPLLPGSSGCLVLVTSRDRLSGLVARESARRVSLDALTADEAVALISGIVGQERASAELVSVYELAELCGHLPLAMRVAAARISDSSHWTIAEHVSLLRRENRLAALSIEGDEQAAVRVAFDYSYDALPDDAQRMFGLLGLAPGPDFTPEAVGALAGQTREDAAAVLDRLASAHLVDQHALRRYTMHDLLRDYARERCESGTEAEERDVATAALHDFYLRHADGASRTLVPHTIRLPSITEPFTFPDADAARAWLDAEHANLVAAVADASTRPSAHEFAWRMADALRGYFHLGRDAINWITAARAALVAAERAGDEQGQAAAYISLGQHAFFCANDYDAAQRHWELALELSTRSGWVHGQPAILSNLGNVQMMLGDTDKTATYYREALALEETASGWPGFDMVRLNLAITHLDLGDLRRCVELAEEALVKFERAGNRAGVAICLLSLGEAFRLQGKFQRARRHLSQALSVGEKVGDVRSRTIALFRLARMDLDLGAVGEAAERVRAALELAREHADLTEADALNVFGDVLFRQGDHQAAVAEHRAALRMAREGQIRDVECAALIGLAAARTALHDDASAAADCERAITLSRASGYRLLEAQAMTVLAGIRLSAGDTKAAVDLAGAAVDIQRTCQYRLGESAALTVLGRAMLHSDDVTARQHLHVAREHLIELGIDETAHLDALLGER
ncbi:DNA-binding SARP family transcriptional activator [Herbihabitans rhizosphaerae]|uniref:DNA-binding SARP family transcriptional activator n=1 Tax=Herbihabitans rhizosphaerae TaxID=1872711 RepID=A0A4Q7KDG4_9PSEU|nr:BTAD domain-containing putative transcriptional regulator [Herbihabitans rhizosphaerae]RZS31425.1 DNA-binding SARP family transcriptional activator [Herbihabitans rhizosphaerae]